MTIQKKDLLRNILDAYPNLKNNKINVINVIYDDDLADGRIIYNDKHGKNFTDGLYIHINKKYKNTEQGDFILGHELAHVDIMMDNYELTYKIKQAFDSLLVIYPMMMVGCNILSLNYGKPIKYTSLFFKNSIAFGMTYGIIKVLSNYLSHIIEYKCDKKSCDVLSSNIGAVKYFTTEIKNHRCPNYFINLIRSRHPRSLDRLTKIKDYNYGKLYS